MEKIKVARMGAGFIADIHIECYHRFVHNAESCPEYIRGTPQKQRHLQRNTIFQKLLRALTKLVNNSGCDSS
jgi:hypothetical protein